MSANLVLNPVATTVAQNAFATTSVGLVQGDYYPDPAIIYKRASGILATTETLPMWGGCAIYEDVPGVAGGPSATLGCVVGRATSLANTLGFSVFSYGMLNYPASPVPLAGSGMQVEYFRLGSGARIIVKADPNLTELAGGLTNQNVSWDYANEQLVPYSSTTISSGTYTSGTGAVALTTAAPHGLQPGDTFELSSVTGTGSFAQLDGEWTATAGTTGSTLNFTAATGLTLTITGGTVATGGILPVKVLDVVAANCMNVAYNTGTGIATWNGNGACAVILI